MHPLMQAIWGVIWKRTVVKKPNRCSKCDFAHFDLFEETYEEAQTSLEMKKVTLFLFILSRSPEDLHEIKSNFEIYNSIDLNDEIDINSITEYFLVKI